MCGQVKLGDAERDDLCEQRWVSTMVDKASIAFADPYALSEKHTGASDCILGASWTKILIRRASAHEMSGVMRRGLHDPAPTQLAKQVRRAPCEVRNAVGGELN